LQLHQFYGEKDQHIFFAEQEAAKEQAIDFSSFNRVLKSGQLASAQQMITQFFDQFQTAVMTPDDIRHFSFLLFMDIHRELIRL
ncbi:DNA-binding response regulator, partial [Vibrio parahaemolyticus]|nr:DNA-binding response regulator [Vibrio parahaemolyticus]